MLKAKLDSVRKNKKGFSLVELIIVIAIMVALVAVMAPAFVKYVQKSRDSALASAAEDYETAVQTFVGDPDTNTNELGSTDILIDIYVDGTTKQCTTAFNGTNADLSVTVDGEETTLKEALDKLAGLDTGKQMGTTTKAAEITISCADGSYKVSMEFGTWTENGFDGD